MTKTEYEFISPFRALFGRIKVDLTKIPHENLYTHIERFAQKYDIKQETAMQFLRAHPEFKIRLGHYDTYINEGHLVAIKQSRIELKNKAQDLYYALTEYFSERELARLLAFRTGTTWQTWQSWLQKELFTEHQLSLTTLMFDSKLVEFVHYGERILRIAIAKEENNSLVLKTAA